MTGGIFRYHSNYGETWELRSWVGFRYVSTGTVSILECLKILPSSSLSVILLLIKHYVSKQDKEETKLEGFPKGTVRFILTVEML